MKKKKIKIPDKYNYLFDILNCAAIYDPYADDWSRGREDLAKEVLNILYEIIQKEATETKDPSHAK